MFDHAIAIELRAAEIYRDFERFFSHRDDVAAFWADLHDDELKHAGILKDTLLSLSRSQLDEETSALMWEQVYHVYRNINKEDPAAVKNLDDAYEIAHQIEASEVNTIFRFLTLECFPSEFREAFISSEIMDHQKKLMDFKKIFGSKAMISGIAAMKNRSDSGTC